MTVRQASREAQQRSRLTTMQQRLRFNELKDGYDCNEVKNELKDGYKW